MVSQKKLSAPIISIGSPSVLVHRYLDLEEWNSGGAGKYNFVWNNLAMGVA